MLVVSLHLSEGFLEYYGPDGAIGGWLGTNRLTVHHRNYIIDNNSLRYAKVEQVDRISTLGLNHVPLCKHFFQSSRSLGDRSCCLEVPSTVMSTLRRMLWNDSVIEDGCGWVCLGEMAKVYFVELILSHK